MGIWNRGDVTIMTRQYGSEIGVRVTGLTGSLGDYIV